MKKILFYTEAKWAYGSIHYGLCKELYKHGIFAEVLNWDINFSQDEFDFLIDRYDLFVTTSPSVMKLHKDYKVPLSKIVATAHGQWDILLARHQAEFDFYPQLRSFGVISDILKEKSIEWGISRVPKVVETGIHFDLFYSEPSESLKTIGYAGTKHTYNFGGHEIKRGHLVDAVCVNIPDIQLKSSGGMYNYLCMPTYYKSVDAVIMSSSEEAGGMPMLEAAAAGRLTIGTPVGFFEKNGKLGGGVTVPIEDNLFVEKTRECILFYKDNPYEYRQKCLEIQAYARDNYDWCHKINAWVDLLS